MSFAHPTAHTLHVNSSIRARTHTPNLGEGETHNVSNPAKAPITLTPSGSSTRSTPPHISISTFVHVGLHAKVKHTGYRDISLPKSLRITRWQMRVGPGMYSTSLNIGCKTLVVSSGTYVVGEGRGGSVKRILRRRAWVVSLSWKVFEDCVLSRSFVLRFWRMSTRR